jgi:hypothetical protein
LASTEDPETRSADAHADRCPDKKHAAARERIDETCKTAAHGGRLGASHVRQGIRAYDLGFFDDETGRVTSVENPFDAKVTYVTGIDPDQLVAGVRYGISDGVISAVVSRGIRGRLRKAAYLTNGTTVRD